MYNKQITVEGDLELGNHMLELKCIMIE